MGHEPNAVAKREPAAMFTVCLANSKSFMRSGLEWPGLSLMSWVSVPDIATFGAATPANPQGRSVGYGCPTDEGELRSVTAGEVLGSVFVAALLPVVETGRKVRSAHDDEGVCREFVKGLARSVLSPHEITVFQRSAARSMIEPSRRSVNSTSRGSSERCSATPEISSVGRKSEVSTRQKTTRNSLPREDASKC